MPELRTDFLTDRSVIVAENRALRPNEFVGEVASATDVASSPDCPFCVGHERQTPPALYEKLDHQGDWHVRVVPNMFPAVALDAAAATGVHEVIIESARHVDRTSALTVLELRDVLETYAHRLRHWRSVGRFAYGLVFKNQGPRAGASLAHLHSQFIALESIPPAVAAELARAEQQCGKSGSCPYCRLIDSERLYGLRAVCEGDGYFAFCPFASLQPHEVWLLPVAHQPSFEDLDPAELERLAGVLRPLIGRLEALVPAAACNLLLRTSPWRPGSHAWCHWRIELLPRVNAIAGFEIATGLFINPLAPERAAAQLRPTQRFSA